MKYDHYFKNVKVYDYVDVYRVLKLFDVHDPCIQHAVKKLLVAGLRGNKNLEKDVHEAIDSLERWKVMNNEDTVKSHLQTISMNPIYKGDDLYTMHSMQDVFSDHKSCKCKGKKCHEKKSDAFTISCNHDMINTPNKVDTIFISDVNDIKHFNLGFNDEWDGMNNIQPLDINTIKL